MTVDAGLEEDVFGLAFAAAGGFVAVGAQVIVVNSTGNQAARIEDGADVLRAGGAVTVEVDAVREVESVAFGIQGGVVAAGAAIAIADVEGSTTASVGNGTIGTALNPVGSYTVSADSNVTVDALAISVKIGLGALSGAVAIATMSGETDSSSDADVFSFGNVSIYAEGDHTADADAPNVAAGVIAIGGTVAVATVDRSIEASVGSGAAINSGGTVEVKADGQNRATADTPGGGGGGLSVSVMVPFATGLRRHARAARRRRHEPPTR